MSSCFLFSVLLINLIYKKCFDCKKEKEIIEFYNCISYPDGKQKRCKNCSKIKGLERTRKLQQNGTYKKQRSPKFLKQEEFIKDYLTYKYTITELSKKYGIDKTTGCKLIKTRGILRDPLNNAQRRHKIKNENYFEIIDTEDKAYFLGLLWTDGCTYADEKGIPYQIVLGLQERDKHILEEFSYKIFYNTDILKIEKGRKQKDGYLRQNKCVLRIRNFKTSNDLLKLGMIPRKTLVLEWPKNLPEHLFSPFLRGVFDGDGSIYFTSKSKSKRYGGALSGGSLSFISKVTEIINLNTQLNLKVRIYTKGKKNPLYMISTSTNLNTKKLFDYLYQNQTIKLNRKYNKYLDLCKFIEDKDFTI